MNDRMNLSMGQHSLHFHFDAIYFYRDLSKYLHSVARSNMYALAKKKKKLKCIALEAPKVNKDTLHQCKHLHRINFDVLNVSVCLPAEDPQA